MQRVVRLPKDRGAHRAHYEWWYAHGYLENEAGNHYGFMCSFFKFDTKTVARFFPQLKAYPTKTLYRINLGITDISGQVHHFDEYTFVPWPGRVGAAKRSLNVYYGSNHIKQIGPKRFDLQMQHHHRQLHLHFFDRKGPVMHGVNGRLGFGKLGSTMYYSHPRLTVHGSFDTETRDEPEFVRGSAWLDHQWGDFTEGQPFLYWNWAGIQLDDGSELMVYEPFTADGKAAAAKATWFGPRGEVKSLKAVWTPLSSWTSPKTKVRYPAEHQIDLPDLKLKLVMRADMHDQEMFSSFFKYWEGSCSVIGKIGSKHITGKSYVELTGYSELSPKGQKLRLGFRPGPRR